MLIVHAALRFSMLYPRNVEEEIFRTAILWLGQWGALLVALVVDKREGRLTHNAGVSYTGMKPFAARCASTTMISS